MIITGGEPTIDKDLLKYVELAKENNFKYVEIQTNARNLSNKRYTKDLISAGVNVFFISIHGHDFFIHELITRKKGSFYETLKGIENIANEGQFIRTNTVLLKPNIKFLPKLGEFISSLSIKEAQLSFPHGNNSLLSYYHIIVPTFTQLKSLLHQTIQIFQYNNVKVKVEAIPPCFLVGYEKCYIDYSDAKYPNFFYEPYWSKNEKISYFDFNTGKTYTKKCFQCDYKPICKGIYTEYLMNYKDYEFYPVKIKT